MEQRQLSGNTAGGGRFPGYWQRLLPCGIATGSILAVYLLTLTKCYQGDALYHAQMVEGLRGHSPYFRPGHLLLIPLLQSWHWLLQQFGFAGRAVLSAQYLNALAGATSVGFLTASFGLVTRNRWLVAFLAILAGGSFGLWWVSVDAHGYSVPVLCLSIALWLLVRGEQAGWLWHGAAVGCWYGAAVLIHQMALFAGPGILLLLALTRKPTGWKIRAALTYLIVCLFLLGGIYAAVGFGCGYSRSVSDFLAWNMRTRGEGPSGSLRRPAYAAAKFVRGFAQMFVWYDDNSSVAGKKFLEGKLGLGDLTRQCSLAPLLIFWTAAGCAILWLALSRRRVRERHGNWPVALVVWCLSFFLFFVSWPFPDPWKWCFVLGPFLLLVAMSADDLLLRLPGRTGRGAATAILLTLAIGCLVNNWVVRMWPESREQNSKALNISRRLGEIMRAEDVLLTPYGRVSGYLEYFEARRVLSIYTLAGRCWRSGDSLTTNRARVLTELRRRIDCVRSGGGRVFLEGTELFTAEDADWMHPWTAYHAGLKWGSARTDLKECLHSYSWRRAVPEFSEVWVLEEDDNEPGCP